MVSTQKLDVLHRALPAADIRKTSIADYLMDMSARLEMRAAEAAELRTRLELTERAHSTLE